MTRRPERIDRALDDLLAPMPQEQFASIVEAMRACTRAVNDKIGSVEECLQRLFELTGRKFEADTFFEIWGAMEEEDLAMQRGSPPPRPLEDMTCEEIARALQRFDEAPIETRDRIIELLTISLPGSFNADLIYYPYGEWTPAELAAEVVKRRELLETGGKLGLRAYEDTVAKSVLSNPASKPWQMQWAEGVMRRAPID